MYDTRVPIIGTALTRPERRVIEKTGAVVASFRVVSNSRRYDKATEQWVDSGMFRIRVNCWRRLAEHVVVSISPGDPIFVSGRIYTREWKTEQGELRVSYEVDADTVGHDLSRGVGVFTKMRYDGPSSVIEDEESDNRVSGEVAHPLGPGAHGTDPYSEDEGSDVAAETAADALAILREAGLSADGDAASGSPGDEDEAEEDDLVGSGGGRRRRGR
jgi:single-strand DNA-binding protein